jgi:hypothetical protein
VPILSGDQKMRKTLLAAVVAVVTLPSFISSPAFADRQASATDRGMAGANVETDQVSGGRLGTRRPHTRATRSVSHRRDVLAYRGSPPAGGDDLVRWCFRTIFVEHGWLSPTPDNPHRKVMSAQHAVEMTDACMRSHGAIR